MQQHTTGIYRPPNHQSTTTTTTSIPSYHNTMMNNGTSGNGVNSTQQQQFMQHRGGGGVPSYQSTTTYYQPSQQQYYRPSTNVYGSTGNQPQYQYHLQQTTQPYTVDPHQYNHHQIQQHTSVPQTHQINVHLAQESNFSKPEARPGPLRSGYTTTTTERRAQSSGPATTRSATTLNNNYMNPPIRLFGGMYAQPSQLLQQPQQHQQSAFNSKFISSPSSNHLLNHNDDYESRTSKPVEIHNNPPSYQYQHHRPERSGIQHSYEISDHREEDDDHNNNVYSNTGATNNLAQNFQQAKPVRPSQKFDAPIQRSVSAPRIRSEGSSIINESRLDRRKNQSVLSTSILNTTRTGKDEISAIERSAISSKVNPSEVDRMKQMVGTEYQRGMVLYDKAQYDQALDRFKESLSLYFKSHLDDAEMCADIYLGMGIVYQAQGEDVAAIELYGKCVETLENKFGKHYPGIVSALVNTGIIYSNQKKHTDALKTFMRAQKLAESKYIENMLCFY
jgi:hypothetical protein